MKTRTFLGLVIGIVLSVYAYFVLYLSYARQGADIMPSTLVLMADSRSVEPTGSNIGYWSLAASLNMRYACSQGYDFAYYHLGE
jgi:hypothetical protein